MVCWGKVGCLPLAVMDSLSGYGMPFVYLFIFLFLCFFRAIQEYKLIYSARILVALVVVSQPLYSFYFFFVESRFALERCKVLLLGSYFLRRNSFLY